MASNRAMTAPCRLRSGVALGLALAVLLGAAAGLTAQDSARLPRARDVLRSAIDTYKRGDYDAAAPLFAQVQQRAGELEANERIDLDTFGTQNNTAMRGRKEGATQVRQAEDALNHGHTAEAAKLLKAATANPYLAAGDRQVLAGLTARLQAAHTAAPKADPRALMTAARAALQKGDLDAAEKLANQAEKAGAGPSLLQPWADTPARVRRDVQAARAKAPAPSAKDFVSPSVMVKDMTPPAPPTPSALPAPSAPPTPVAPAHLTQLPAAPTPVKEPVIPPPLPTAKAPTVPSPAPIQATAPTSPYSPQAQAAPLVPPLVPEPPAPPVPARNTVAKVETPTSPYSPQLPAPTPPAPPAPIAAPVPPAPIAAPVPPAPVTVQAPTPVVPVAPPAAVPLMPPPASPPRAAAAAALPAPPALPASPPMPPDQAALARQMLERGYQALDAGDLDTARQMAYRVKDLHVDLGANGPGPDQLLQDVQKKVAATAKIAKASATTDSRALVREARALFKQGKLDDAEKLCNDAATVPNAHWGLFEDTPERVRHDIQTARAQRNRDESVQLLVEARKLYTQGKYDDAKKKAWRAQELHGPYGAFDFGDRPQRLLGEIARAEAARKSESPRTPPAPPEAPLAQTKDNAPVPVAKTADPAPPPAAGTAQLVARTRAVSLVAEARDLERRGQLGDAHKKAAEALKLGVVFPPGEDSPEAVMLSLSAKGKGQIQVTLQQVHASVAGQPSDPARVQKAQADLVAARQLAVQFGLDTAAIDQKVVWLQQAAAAGRAAPAVATAPQAPALPPVAQVDFKAAPPAADPKTRAALEKLDKARLELRSGNCAIARKLAEEAFDPANGVQKQAEAVLRDIDAEEHAQRVLAAQRSFQAGMDAYLHGDYRRAGSIFASVDTRLLPPQQQERLRDVMTTREMQPQPVVQAGHKELLKPGPVGGPAPGVAVATDQGDDAIDNVKAMEKVQFEQMYQRNLQAQRSALELFKGGQEMKAIEVLSGQLTQVDQAQFGPEYSRQLKTPLEKRLQEFRTLQAQKLLAKQRDGFEKTNWNEGEYQKKVRSQQEQVADLIKQCNALRKQGKTDEALAMAQKAKELDPDNLAADAFIQMATIERNQKRNDKVKSENEDGFLQTLTFGMGEIPDDAKPYRISKDGLERMEKRKSAPPYIMQQTKNPKERAIEYRLDQPIHFGFQDTALRDVIDSLSKLSGVPVYPDSLALQESSISLDHPLTMDSNGLSMKSALNILLGKMRLTYVIQNEALIITTADKAKSNFKQVVYPIADLIVPVENHPVEDVYDLTAVLQKHMNSQGALQNYMGASPVNPMHALPPAPAVSSYGSGLGSAFGATSQSQAQQPTSYSPIQKRAPGQTMEDLLVDLIKGTIHPNTWKDMGGPGTVQFYPLGMALVINQTQEVQEDIVALLAALRRLQDMEVAIEMRLVSVSESFYERIGVDFDVNLRTPSNQAAENQLLNQSFTPFGTVNRNLNFSRFISGLTPAGTLTPDLNVPIRNSSFNFSVPPFGGYTAPGLDGGLSLGLAFLSDIQVFMILEAAQGDRRTNIMQAPKMTVFNGQTATLTVSTTQFVNLGITAVPINGQIVFQPNNTPLPIGVTLTVTPVVSADRRFVRLNLTPSMTNLISNDIPVFPVQIPLPNLVDGPLGIGVQTGQPVLFNTFLIQQPQISTIRMSTTVNVPDGGTVLLGGLKTMSEGRNEAGPPILSKIPYLSRLFRNVGWGRDGQSLMILVTPRIIINEEEEQVFLGNIPPIPRP